MSTYTAFLEDGPLAGQHLELERNPATNMVAPEIVTHRAPSLDVPRIDEDGHEIPSPEYPDRMTYLLDRVTPGKTYVYRIADEITEGDVAAFIAELGATPDGSES